jgi:hypothetical protein
VWVEERATSLKRSLFFCALLDVWRLHCLDAYRAERLEIEVVLRESGTSAFVTMIKHGMVDFSITALRGQIPREAETV